MLSKMESHSQPPRCGRGYVDPARFKSPTNSNARANDCQSSLCNRLASHADKHVSMGCMLHSEPSDTRQVLHDAYNTTSMVAIQGLGVTWDIAKA
jgi:hypothetical protein